MRPDPANRLQRAVTAICPEIDARLFGPMPAPTETDLWRELCICILSSQVPYALAQAAAFAIEADGVLADAADRTQEVVHNGLQRILSDVFVIEGRPRRYRFPNTKSAQLAQTWATVRQRAGSLSGVLSAFRSDLTARDWLVRHVCGMGPKQASMFLRNVGRSYDLAILDRHVIAYMQYVGLSVVDPRSLQRLTYYQEKEAVLQRHAAGIGYPVGLLDWAIWIVMRVANLDARMGGCEQ